MTDAVFNAITKRMEELECIITDCISQITGLNAQIDEYTKEYYSLLDFINESNIEANKGNSETQKHTTRKRTESVLDAELEARKLGMDYETYMNYTRSKKKG